MASQRNSSDDYIHNLQNRFAAFMPQEPTTLSSIDEVSDADDGQMECIETPTTASNFTSSGLGPRQQSHIPAACETTKSFLPTGPRSTFHRETEGSDTTAQADAQRARQAAEATEKTQRKEQEQRGWFPNFNRAEIIRLEQAFQSSEEELTARRSQLGQTLKSSATEFTTGDITPQVLADRRLAFDWVITFARQKLVRQWESGFRRYTANDDEFYDAMTGRSDVTEAKMNSNNRCIKCTYNRSYHPEGLCDVKTLTPQPPFYFRQLGLILLKSEHAFWGSITDLNTVRTAAMTKSEASSGQQQQHSRPIRNLPQRSQPFSTARPFSQQQQNPQQAYKRGFNYAASAPAPAQQQQTFGQQSTFGAMHPSQQHFLGSTQPSQQPMTQQQPSNLKRVYADYQLPDVNDTYDLLAHLPAVANAVRKRQRTEAETAQSPAPTQTPAPQRGGPRGRGRGGKGRGGRGGGRGGRGRG